MPKTASSPTLQFSKITSAVSLARIPNLSSFLPAFKPGFPRSTIKAVIPLLSNKSPVRAITTTTSPDLPWVIKFLTPFKIQPSPSFLAVHIIRIASLPVFGSVKAQAPIN